MFNVNCDTASQCDGYVKIFIDEQQVYYTKTIRNDDHPMFFQTFTSNKIKKNAVVRFELWDADRFLDGSDDRIIFWTTDIEELLKNGCFPQSINFETVSSSRCYLYLPRGETALCTTSSWEDEFLFD